MGGLSHTPQHRLQPCAVILVSEGPGACVDPVPWVPFVCQSLSWGLLYLFNHLLFSDLQPPKAQFLCQVGLRRARGFALATGDTDWQINTGGGFVQETKLKIAMIHLKSCGKYWFFGWMEQVPSQFCVLLSCPHVWSSCAEDF